MRDVLLACLLLAAPVAADAEGSLKEKVAKAWIDHARWAKVQGARGEAARALDEAAKVDPSAQDLERLRAEVEALAEGGEVAGLEARSTKAHQEIAKLYDKLAALKHAPADEPRFEEYLFRAVELDPSKGRTGKILGLVRKQAQNRAKAEAAARMLVRLREADPGGSYDALETELALEDVALVKHKDHAMVGWLSLPKGWKRKGEWSVLVAVDGAGSNFLGAARGFAQSRGSRDYLVLAPCSLSNTNALEPAKYPFYSQATLDEGNRDRIGFDLAGLDGLLAVLKERFGASDRIGITGFSGGGNLCYGWLARHPDRTRFAIPACANFSGLGFQSAQAVEGGGPPIRILTGANDEHKDFTFGKKDSPGIEPQTDRAVEALGKLGFTKLERRMLPGVGHSSCQGQVWEFADEVAK
jgi:dienelactone hydrolase